MNKRIKFNVPYYDDAEVSVIKDYLDNGTDYKSMAVEYIQEKTKADEVMLTSGATSAMDTFFAGIGLPHGSEVIMPSYTFPAAANVVLRAGLKPVFADIDRDTLVMNHITASEKITRSTSCIMPVHYGGTSADLDKLSEICNDKNICLFEDAALSYGGYYKGKHLGTIGTAGVISFHNTKNLSGDGGGVLLLNDEHDNDTFKMLMANGTDKPLFLRGGVPEYTWKIMGAGAEMSGLTAALLWAQLKKDDAIFEGRKQIWDTYYSILKAGRLEEYCKLPVIPEFNTANYHVFYLNFINNNLREHVRKELNAMDIQAVIHYKPLHSSAMGHKLGCKISDLPVTNKTAECILRLPVHMAMSINDVEYICERVKRVLSNV